MSGAEIVLVHGPGTAWCARSWAGRWTSSPA